MTISHWTIVAYQLQMKCFCYQAHSLSCYDQSSNQCSTHEGDADDDDDGDDFDDGTSYDEAMTYSSDSMMAFPIEYNSATASTMNSVKFVAHDTAIVVDVVAN